MMNQRKIPRLLGLLSCTILLCTGCFGADAAAFQDVPEDAWYREAVDYVTANGYFQGLDESTFAPRNPMTRAMFITVLGRMQKFRTGDYAAPGFSDTTASGWYAPYLGWAVESGIAAGYPDGSFQPDAPVNHEQMAVFLTRYAAHAGLSLPKGAYAPFADGDAVSGWAVESVAAVAAAGIYPGDTNGRFLPQTESTRAEVAFALMRMDRVKAGETPPAFQIPARESGADARLAEMSLYEKVYQMFVVSPEKLTGVSTVTQAGETTKNALAQYPVGGIMYNTKNLRTAEQVTEMIANTKAYSKTAPFISVDEEGGNVARVAGTLGTTAFSPMYTYRDEGPAKAYEIGAVLARDISRFGFNQDYAPVADVWTNPANRVISTRAFSGDPNAAADMVAAAVKGMQDNGVIATVKHFPGHGDTAEDSHTGRAYSHKDLDQLRACEFLPFRAGIAAGVDFVMCAHITVPAVDALPATMSKTLVTDILRGELGFSGVVITDAMEMQAISSYYPSGTAAVNAVKAGCDMILSPDTLAEAAQGVIAAVESGEISQARIDESVRRILTVKEKYGILN